MENREKIDCKLKVNLCINNQKVGIFTKNRIMKTISYILFTLFSIFTLRAQNTLQLCEKYDENGTASGVYSEWTITPTAGYIYILYNQPRNLTSGLWYLYIDKDWDNTGVFSAYETINLTPDESKNWIVYDYNFKEAGDYKAYIMYNGVQMAGTSFNLKMDGSATSTSTSLDEIDTYYYESSNVVFCQSVDDNGQLSGVKSVFDRVGGNAEVMIYISNSEKPFKTNKIYLDVYKTGSDELYDSDSFEIEEDWDWIKFKYTFSEPGEYVFDLYTANDIFINSSPNLLIR